MGILPEKIKKQLNAFFTKNTVIFLVCVLIATIFWLLTKLSNNYTSDIKVEVMYTNLPEDKVVRNKLPNEVTLFVNASGWDLLRQYLNISTSSIIIDAKEFVENGRMYTNNYRNVFSQQLDERFDVQRILPSEIKFQYDEKSTRKLPVKLRSNIQIDRQHGLSDTIQLTPDSITLTGPAPVLDTMTSVKTDTLRLKNVSQTVTGQIDLEDPPVSSISYSQPNVAYQIPIAQFTETSISVPIKAVNTTGNPLLMSKDVKVSFQVPVDRVKMYEMQELKNQFEVVADFSMVNEADSLVPVMIKTHPPELRNLTVSPERVSFLYLKK